VWSDFQQVGPLVECLPDHPILLIVQVEDSLLEVAYSAMDQLCAPTTCSCGEVILFY